MAGATRPNAGRICRRKALVFPRSPLCNQRGWRPLLNAIRQRKMLPYPQVTYLLFVVFLVLMTILIMNLLVGLAVDDIKAVQDQAILKRLAMQTQLVLDVEGLLPEAFRRIYMVSRREVHPNARHSLLSRVFGDFKLIRGFDFIIDGEEMNEQELMRRDLSQLVTKVEGLQSQNKRLHALLLALTSVANRGDESKDHLDSDLAKYLW